jgi:hypothetical protein
MRAAMPAYPSEPMTWVTNCTMSGRMRSVMGFFSI